MARIIFEINYDIKPETKEQYLSTVHELAEHLTASGKTYMVVEDMNKTNNFTEVYICKDETEYDNLEDESDDKTNEYAAKILSEFVKGSTKYTTRKEV